MEQLVFGLTTRSDIAADALDVRPLSRFDISAGYSARALPECRLSQRSRARTTSARRDRAFATSYAERTGCIQERRHPRYDVHRFVARVSCDPFARAIERSELSFEVMCVDQVVCVLEQIAKTGLAFLQCLFRLLSFGDIANDAREESLRPSLSYSANDNSSSTSCPSRWRPGNSTAFHGIFRLPDFI